MQIGGWSSGETGKGVDYEFATALHVASLTSIVLLSYKIGEWGSGRGDFPSSLLWSTVDRTIGIFFMAALKPNSAHLSWGTTGNNTVTFLCSISLEC